MAQLAEQQRPGLNINTQVLMQASLGIFIGNWQKWLEGGVITDRSITNQQESSVPVAMFASRQNWIMSRLRVPGETCLYALVYLSSSPCFIGESKRAVEENIITCHMLQIPRELLAVLRGRNKYLQATEIVAYGAILKWGTIIGILIIARRRANNE